MYICTTCPRTYQGHLHLSLKALARSSLQQPQRRVPSSPPSTRSIHTYLQTAKRKLCTRQSRSAVYIFTRVRHDRPCTSRNHRLLDRAPASILQEPDTEPLKVCHITRLRGQLILRTTTYDEHSNVFFLASSLAQHRAFSNLPAREVRIAE